MNKNSRRKMIRYLFMATLAATGVSAGALSVSSTQYHLALKRAEKLRNRNYNLADQYLAANLPNYSKLK